MRGGWMKISKKFKDIIEISVEKKRKPAKEDSQNGEDTYITLDIETDPIWLEFEEEIQKYKKKHRE